MTSGIAEEILSLLSNHSQYSGCVSFVVAFGISEKALQAYDFEKLIFIKVELSYAFNLDNLQDSDGLNWY